MRRTLPRWLLLSLTCCACAAPRPATPDHPLAWLLGEWRGSRRHEADGSTAPLTVRFRPALGGTALCEELTVARGGAAAYRGFALWRPDGAGGWFLHYTNDGRRGFVELDGSLLGPTAARGAPAGIAFRRGDAAAARRSRSVLTPVGDDAFRRTMHVAEDGGPWRPLWTDEVRRN